MSFTRAAAAVLALLPWAAASAQEPVVIGLLPDSVAEHALAIYNRDGTVRLSGESEIAAGTRVEGAVAVLNGPLRIAGSVAGDVVVINGDADVAASAEVSGVLTVIGGEVSAQPGARVAGGMVSYREALRFRYADDRLVYVPPHPEQGLSAGRDWSFGRTDLFLAAQGAYNRVEGLPVAFGPRLRLGGSNPTRLRALAIIRTASGLSTEPKRLGYQFSAEQELGVPGFMFGLQLFSEVAAIEQWHVSERESSLATFLLHKDYRDHYDRAGGMLSLRLDRPDLPLTGQLWYRLEDHEPVRPHRPLTLLDNDDPWRAETWVAEGRLHSIGLDWRYDTRNAPDDPSWGWYIQGRLEQGLGGDLQPRDPELAGAATARTGFNAAQLDLRRYSRISPYSLLGLRVVAAGSIDGKGLPPQRQHALGGEGSLPAFGLLQFDCGARNRAAEETAGRYPYYGCDRMALVQLEYQASFPLARRLGDRIGLSSHFTNSVRWVAFFDAGRAWTEPDARAGRGGGNEDFSADAGVGIRIGGIGAYWAVPLSGGERPINFFVRVGPRL
jgi:hypothetical protein